MSTPFVGSSRALSKSGLLEAAQSVSVRAPEIWAVLAVETSGCGFLPDRRPQILFERHIFHKLTNGRFDDGDISDATAGGYGALGANQYDRLQKAVSKDRVAALKSASWGLGQIMGSNFTGAGFPDVETMVAAMCESEDAQLSAVIAFLKSSRLDAALQQHDWSAFAAGYNGPAYAKNQYDTRLRSEYLKYAGGAEPDLDLRAAQLYLTFAGFHPGAIDGIAGARTRSAISDFQTQQKLPVTGEVDGTLLDRLLPKFR